MKTNRIYRHMGLQGTRLIGWLLLAATIGASAATSGCIFHRGPRTPRPDELVTTVYDPVNHDWHHWDDNERAAYKQYWSDTHQPYRTYGALQQNDVNAYWTWRHAHPDAAPAHS